MRARPVATRCYLPRSSPSPLNYTDPSGFSAQASEDAAIGVGAGFFTGLVVHLLTSGGEAGIGAASVGASSAGAASAGSGVAAAGAGAASAATALAAAGVGAGIASSVAGNIIASGHQPTSTIASTPPATRTATAAGTGTTPVGRTSFATMATSPVQEGAAGPPQPPAAGSGPSPQSAFVKDGRITDAAHTILQRTFDRYKFNSGQIRVIFKHNLGQSGITLGNRVYLDDRFQHLRPYYQMRLLAHEITHSVQYRDLGKANFLERYAVGYGLPDNYDIPTELWAVPTDQLSVTQTGTYLGQDGYRHDFTLDQIAERIGTETASGVPQ